MDINTRNGNQIWRVIDVINWARQYFKKLGFDNPRREIEWLLQDLFNCKRVDLYLRFEKPLSKQELKTLRSWIKRRLTQEPLQYITGQTEFFGRKFIVDSKVFIPRPETEQLIDAILRITKNDKNINILDIGTGGGCIAVTLARELPNAKVTGIDNSHNAIENASKNAEAHEIRNIEFKLIDILKEIPKNKFSLIVSNPPYIPNEEIENLIDDVKNFEPQAALTDFEDGMVFYKRLLAIAPQILKKNGYILMEVGRGRHPKKVQELFGSPIFNSIELIRDLNGDERIIKARLA